MNKYKYLIRKELSLLFIVGIIGCCGTLFVFNKAWNSFHSVNNEDYLNMVILNKKKKSSTIKSEINHLAIQGNKVAGFPLEFHIPNFNPKAQYTIDFGNGDHININKAICNYQYKRPGNYFVQLSMNYKGQATALFNQNISIASSLSYSD